LRKTQKNAKKQNKENKERKKNQKNKRRLASVQKNQCLRACIGSNIVVLFTITQIALCSTPISAPSRRSPAAASGRLNSIHVSNMEYGMTGDPHNDRRNNHKFKREVHQALMDLWGERVQREQGKRKQAPQHWRSKRTRRLPKWKCQQRQGQRQTQREAEAEMLAGAALAPLLSLPPQGPPHAWVALAQVRLRRPAEPLPAAPLVQPLVVRLCLQQPLRAVRECSRS
jgi:hypothetical protein